MTVKTGQAWAGTFVTLDSTGALAAGTPSGVLYVDGTANGAAVTISGSNPYKWAVTLPTLTAGQRVDMYITATIATIATAGIVASEQADTSLLSDGVAVASIANDAITAAALKADAVTEIQNGIAGDVWSHATRTLTVPAVAIASNVDGTTLSLYKDADINIEFTGLTIPAGSKKVVFTIKDNLDDADTVSALQATYQLVAPSTETHTLNYINSAVPTGLTNPVTFTVDTDSVEFDMTAAAAYLLPRYERGYLHWDLKLITATTVQILQQGLVQILGTSTRTVA